VLLGDISVHLLVKDEEENLTRLLPYLVQYFDEIVVIDTGSTDNTVAIAKSYTSHVHTFDMKMNFSDARNFGLKQVTKPWVFQIDADELPTLPLFAWLMRWEPHDKTTCALIRRHNLVDEKSIGKNEYEWHPRVFCKESIFYGRIHENLIVPDGIVERAPEDCILQHYKTAERQERQNAFYSQWEEQPCS